MGVVTKRSSMTYFSDAQDHYSHRVRIVLAEKGVTYDLEDIDPLELTEEVSELTPYNSLPVLLDRDLVLYESKVMMEYLDERFPHPPLLPVYPVTRAESRLWMHRIEKDWSPLVDIIVAANDPESVAVAVKELKESLIQKKSDLIVIHSLASEAITHVIDTFKIDAIYINRDYEPHAIKRDEEIRNIAIKKNVDFYDFKDLVVFEKDEILTALEKPYTVFTPYKNNYLKKTNLILVQSSYIYKIFNLLLKQEVQKVELVILFFNNFS